MESRLFLSASLFKDLNATQGPGTGLSEMIWAGNVAYLSQDDLVTGRELWKSDGSANGTVLVKDIFPGGVSSAPSKLTAGANPGEVFFVVNDPIAGNELWHSDGTANGTSMVVDINPNGSSNPTNLTLANGVLYFTADDGVHGAELWRVLGDEVRLVARKPRGRRRERDALAEEVREQVPEMEALGARGGRKGRESEHHDG